LIVTSLGKTVTRTRAKVATARSIVPHAVSFRGNVASLCAWVASFRELAAFSCALA